MINTLNNLNVLSFYQAKIEDKIRLALPRLGSTSKLKEACAFALMNGGKRFRPAITYMVATALNRSSDVSEAALAIEYFHTASLIADDLPCMDNELFRRDKPALHVAFGEATALLASYALIAAGYDAIVRAAASSPFDQGNLCLIALQNATFNAGACGATGGQCLDLYPEQLNLENLEEIITKKTISLFEISFVFGWIFGGGDLKLLPLIKRASYHFGMAFQIADDLIDLKQDMQSGKKINMALMVGVLPAKKRVEEEMSCFFHLLKELGLNDEEFKTLLICTTV